MPNFNTQIDICNLRELLNNAWQQYSKHEVIEALAKGKEIDIAYLDFA